ncbi:hypothetical protein C4J98_0196 [Pseudomonas orientalis]|uniref:hypothetical protein n=1 Tax=Pseudomonas orientalis TaxID=76758 RepID=UPI000F5763F5|nr:hypothetical protein [Pseudomonas orientalis]AZE81641.1 hypothetical protein C4J98_0196 [Pseudomonas orientalis]
MNICSRLGSTFDSNLPCPPQNGRRHGAPRALQGENNAHTVNFADSNARPQAFDSTAYTGSEQKSTNGGAPVTRFAGLDASRTKRSAPSEAYQRGTLSGAGRPYTQNELLSGFSQKWGTMNCVTVAGIKAAMQRFGGPDQVYASVERTSDGFTVRMRDNPAKTYHVTHAELNEAAARSGFRGTNQKMLNEANFMYAVSAKRAQMENNDGYASQSFSAALNSLDSWEHTHEGLDRLGLRNYVRPASAQELINGVPGVMAQNDHVFTVLNGRTDNYGTSGYRPDPRAYALTLR